MPGDDSTRWPRFLPLRDDLLQQREQGLRRGDLRGVAGVDVVVAPAWSLLRHRRELAEGVVGIGAQRVDVAARQCQWTVVQLERLDETLQRMVDAAFGAPVGVLLRRVRRRRV